MSGFLFLPVLALGLVALAGPALVLWLLVLVFQLRRRVRALQDRVAALEHRPAGGPVASAVAPPPGPPGPTAAAEPGAWPVTPGPPPARPPDVVGPAPAGREGTGVSPLEGRLGTTWLNRTGVVLLVLGGGFFLKYAFESDWMGPAGRIGLGLGAGLALLVLGLALQGPTYRVPAQGLVAAGLGLCYLSGYAAHAVYALVGLLPAFALMAVVTGVGLAVALRHDGRALAFLANLGAFLTPVLLEPEGKSPGWLFAYLALVDVGILGAAVRRRWPELTVLSFVGTQFLYWDWLLPWPGQSGRMRAALAGATGFFVIFALVGLARARRWPDGMPTPRGRISGLLVLAPATAYFLALREILEPDHPGALALVCLVLAAGYFAAGRALRAIAGQATPPAVLHLAAGLAFLTLALAVRLDTPTVVLAWAAEAMVLLAGGLRTDSRALRAGGLVILGLAGLRWFALLDERSGGRFLVDHPALPATVALAAAGAVGAALYGWRGLRAARPPVLAGDAAAGRVLPRGEAVIRPLLILLAVGSLATLVTVELRALSPWGVPGPVGHAGVLVTWTLAALPLLALARGDRTRLLLVAVSLLLATLALRAVADAEGWRTVAPPLRPVLLNVRFLAVLLLVVAAGLYARVVPEFPCLASRTGARLGAIGAGAAGVLLLWNLSAEILLWPLPGRPAAHADKLRNAGLSILWALYAFAAMGVGMWRRRPALRLSAIALFGLTVAKVLFVDLSALDAAYRILSFLVLGAVLLVASFLYTRYRARPAGGPIP